MVAKRNLGRMKTYAVAVAAGLLLLAGYSHKSEATPCATSGGFEDLVGTTCEIGDKTFSNFSILGDLAATDVQYATIDGVDGFWGFEFQFNLTVGQNGTADFSISYRAACTNGSSCIDSAHLVVTGGTANGGIAAVDETVLFPNGDTLGMSAGPGESATVTFTPVQFVTLSKDHNVFCPDTLNCRASISNVRNTVDQVPEPASLALLAAGLAAFGWVGRRRANHA